MFYTVECNYTDPESEQEWNAFYSWKTACAYLGHRV